MRFGFLVDFLKDLNTINERYISIEGHQKKRLGRFWWI